MSNVVYQNDIATGNPVPQTSTGNAADVNIVSGQVQIDATNNAVTLEANATGGPLNATTTVYAASLLVKAGPGKLFGVTGYNSKGSAQWIQIHDSATLPAEAAIPKITFTVATVANFSIEFGDLGRSFANGIYMVNSSTGPTKTIGSADIFVDAQYK